MPRLQEIPAEEDSPDACSPTKDEESIPPHQFQAFKKTEYDSLHLSPGKSVLKVLWERVSAEIAQRSGHPIQAGVKGSLNVKKTWSPPTTHYEEYPASRHQLHPPKEKPSAEAAWDRVSKAAWDRVNTDLENIADIQEELPSMNKGRDESEQQFPGSDQEIAPSLAAREQAQVEWNRDSTTIDRKNVAGMQEDNISYTGSREEEGDIQSEKEGDNLSLAKSNPERQPQLEEDATSSEKPQGAEDVISSKTQDSTSDFAPRGEQEDQDSVEEKVTTYDTMTKEQMEEDADPKRLVKKDTPTFGTQEINCHLAEYLEERPIYKKEVERNQYSAFVMDSQQTGLPIDKIQEEVKPRHMLHEDVPRSKTMEFLSSMSDSETKRGGSEEMVEGEVGEEEEVPYLSYNPPEATQKAQLVELEQETPELQDNLEQQETTRDEKIEALRKELETLEGYDEEDESCLFDEESLSLRAPPAREPESADGRTYVMPDPVRARLDDEVLLYHVPRSPEAPRRFSDKVFFRFK